MAQLDHLGRAGRGDLVEPVAAMDQPGMLGAEIAQHLRHRLQPVAGEDAEQLALDAGRVRHRAHEVEDRAGAELGAGRADMAHRAVMLLRPEEAGADLVERALDRRHVGLDIDAEGGQHVGGAALGRGGAVAVLGDRRHRRRRR